VRAVLERPLYRGVVVYGKTAKAYGRELGKRTGKPREKGIVPRPEDRWLRLDRPELRIVDPDVIARVDARRLDRRTRYLASVAKGGRVLKRAHGKYLLSGGMLSCPQCGGHFEARIAPWKGQANVYICSTRRRKPGVCTNTLALPIAETDDDVLGIVEGEMLGTRFIEELLALVDTTRCSTGSSIMERPQCRPVGTRSPRGFSKSTGSDAIQMISAPKACSAVAGPYVSASEEYDMVKVAMLPSDQRICNRQAA
jgi:hypothetical protein